ncbi:MAG TPA: insulinase family protein [Pyrinomonadaceae bacterium]|jgi:predicted Zn-dependent peptidase|nr:insulinase family protein [Pyrinomonadaceae bacterium]
MLCKRLLAASLAALLLASAAPALAQKGKSKAPAAAAADKGARVLPPINFTQFTLKNGLRVILHEDHSTPIVGVNLWYHVGSKNEEKGRTGFAHLFEHMMFQGFKGYDYDYIPVIQEVGGAINGSTNQDRTNYWELVPSNFLETALFMEAGRMGNLLEAMTETKLANQRDVVKNEKRQRIDNQPYGQAFYKIQEAMYPEGHPYRWPVIGSMEDLTAASIDDVKAFFRRYYVPNNASLVISGDFDPKEARALVEKYFGPIPRGEEITRPQAPLPALAREVREQIDDRVQLPRVYMVWHSAPQFSKDEAALDLLSSILGGGKSGRLYKALQYDQQLAQQAAAFNQTSEIAGLFQVVATARPERSLEEIERAINAEVEKLKTTPPTPEEMERVYNAREASFVYGLQTVGGFGGKDDQLNAYATFVGRPDYFEQDLARYRAVTAADIQRVARQYLTDKRYVLSVVPRAAGQQMGASAPAPASPREAIAPPSQQTAGTQQPGAANAAAQPAQTGTASGTQQGAAQSTPPAGAQTMTRPEAQAAQTSGAAPPQTASPAAAPRQGQATGMGAGRPAGAQQAAKAKTGDRSLLPKEKPDPKLTLPAAQRRKLSNGLEVVVVEHHELPVVSFNLVTKMGAAGDPSGKAGLASLTADMIDEGTATRDSLAISDQLARIGSSLQVAAGWDSTTASMRTLTRHMDRALEIYSDVITNPAFPDKELQRLRAQRLAALRQQRDDPNSVAGLVFQTVLYGREHPYGHPLTGDEASLQSLTGEDVRGFYDKFFRPNNSALIVVGDVKPDQVVAKLEKAFAAWKSAHVPAVDVSAAPVQREHGQIFIVDRPGSVQSVIQIGQVAVPRSSPDYFPLFVMNRILGGSSSARINLNLREDKGYTYGAQSGFSFRRGAGPFIAAAPVQGFSTKESVAEFMKEIRGIRGEIPVTQAELEAAKQAIVRGFARNFETPDQIASQFELIVTYDLPDTYFNTYVERVQAVTLEDVNRVANRHLQPDRMAVVVVGDRSKIEQGLRSLETYGERVTLVDTEGRPAAPGGQSGGGTR